MWVPALDDRAEEPGSVPYPHDSSRTSVTLVPEVLMPSADLWAFGIHVVSACTDIHANKTAIHIT